MSKKFFFLGVTLCLVSFLIFSCKKREKEENLSTQENSITLIEREKMKELLVEAYIAEGVIATSPAEISKYTLTKQLYDELFEKYNTSSEQFEFSLNYYFQHKEKSKILLDEVRSFIEIKKDSLQKILE